ncbi:SDR family oxidoreductase [Streptomyces sp. CBMA123]|uniref:SDR family oxidoreductase n=1 Tax=Streptomyces sp. CBMA123 TaxID=1896313 RepID=UPI001CB7CE2E|nr:SDR family oxidoreductase [Streptomyces sp. CBMA123]MBD0692156.1 hypothetical protein [Streptomyces sp. CBMA123]
MHDFSHFGYGSTRLARNLRKGRSRGLAVRTPPSAAEQARPDVGAYTARKRVIQGLVKAAALAYGTRGIRIHAILPGTTGTAFVRPPGIPDAAWAAFRKAYGPLNTDGLERMPGPDAIARAIMALTSDDFGCQTCASAPVDGGATAGGGRPCRPRTDPRTDRPSGRDVSGRRTSGE